MKTHHKNSERLVTKIFQDVCDKYDLMNDLMSSGVHRLWKKNFINWLNPKKNTILVDVASGTGDIAQLYLDKINYKGNVYCVDENKGMLDLNKRKFKIHKILRRDGTKLRMDSRKFFFRCGIKVCVFYKQSTE